MEYGLREDDSLFKKNAKIPPTDARHEKKLGVSSMKREVKRMLRNAGRMQKLSPYVSEKKDTTATSDYRSNLPG
jgi:hypothetical protein